jgi:hypothetical protein
MTSTITAATLTVTITEEVSLNGKDQGAKNTYTIASVKEISNRIVTIPSGSEVIVVAMGTAVAAGQYVEGTTKYIRLTNKDDANHITLVFRNENSDEFAVKLDAGQTFIYNGDNTGGVVDTMDAAATALSVSFGDLVDITAQANTAACDLEIFVAGT